MRLAPYDTMTATLCVDPGSVTPLAMLFATTPTRLLLDVGFRDCSTLLFHPMVNTATTSISPAAFERFLAHHNIAAEWVDFSLGPEAKIPEPPPQTAPPAASAAAPAGASSADAGGGVGGGGGGREQGD